MKLADNDPCPCGSARTLSACCAVIHRDGAGLGATAEQLMRARYSAYALGLDDFVLSSWHPDTRPPNLGSDPGNEWLGLEVLATERGTAFDATGTVEFVARFRRAGETGEPSVLHERSTFERVDGRWVYVDGEV